MSTLYLYTFNNYYNRQIKYNATIAGYGSPIKTITKVNFEYGNGLRVLQTINFTVLEDPLIPDYAIVKEDDNTFTRWFVLDSTRTRGYQYKLDLKRDVIADYYEDVIYHSPCLIRKGYVPNNSHFTFNAEGVNYNKIKEEEILIKDKSKCSYIVGFIANNYGGGTIDGTIKPTDPADYAYPDLASFPLHDYVLGAGQLTCDTKRVTGGLNENNNIKIALRNTIRRQVTGGYEITNGEMTFGRYGAFKPSWYTNSYATGTKLNDYLYIATTGLNGTEDSDYKANFKSLLDEENEIVERTMYNLIISNMDKDIIYKNASYAAGCDNDTVQEWIDAYDGKIISLNNIKYKMKISYGSTTNRTVTYTNGQGEPLYFPITTAMLNANLPSQIDVQNALGGDILFNYVSGYDKLSDNDYSILVTTKDAYINLTPATEEVHTTVPNAAGRTHLANYPYDMFVMIYDDNVPYKVGTTDYVSNQLINVNIAQAICQATGATAVYDLQIVPYNPIQGAILNDGTINWLNYDVQSVTDDNNTVVGHYVFCSSCDFEFSLTDNEYKLIPTDYKKDFNTKEYRLCSPNYETVFEFSPAMNGGIDTWNICCSYKPFASYIKVQPKWGFMYGNTLYNNKTDFRGLVYNSSMCLTQLNEAWATYVSSNKNYQQIFDNSINTLSTEHDIQINAQKETLGLRSFTGMPIGSVLRVIGGTKDIDMQEELHNVAIQKMEKDFKYQLDNIKAQPNTIRKLSNVTPDTRIFPYIEIYGASGEDIDAYDKMIKYTGMSIMATGYIINYLKENEETFIQADLIRLVLGFGDKSSEYNIAREIANELDKGIYLTTTS